MQQQRFLDSLKVIPAQAYSLNAGPHLDAGVVVSHQVALDNDVAHGGRGHLFQADTDRRVAEELVVTDHRAQVQDVSEVRPTMMGRHHPQLRIARQEPMRAVVAVAFLDGIAQPLHPPARLDAVVIPAVAMEPCRARGYISVEDATER